MRDILFRGIGIKSREWVYGAYVPAMDEDSCDSIIDEQGEQHIVFSDTVGQYTGLKDRHGDRIWEGDIVRRDDYDNYVVKYGYFNEHGENSAPSDSWGWYLNGCCDRAISTPHVIHSIDGIMALFPRYTIDNKQYSIPRLGFQIIGNIHDNPDLLK